MISIHRNLETIKEDVVSHSFGTITPDLTGHWT